MAWDQQGAFPSLGGGASAGGQTASIFAALALAPTSKPRTAASTAAATASAAAPTPDPSLGPLGYFVTGSKKGAFPVGLEKRGCGKKVTVVKNVVGDAGALLQALKKRLGCGGAVCPGGSSVEVQGERKAEVERFLADAGCVKAASGADKAAAAPAKAGAQRWRRRRGSTGSSRCRRRRSRTCRHHRRRSQHVLTERGQADEASGAEGAAEGGGVAHGGEQEGAAGAPTRTPPDLTTSVAVAGRLRERESLQLHTAVVLEC